MSTPFRFIHTADLHLDSPLKSLARRDEALADHVANATRTALSRTIDLCLEQQVNALLLAGDIYDSHHPSVASVGFFIREINRLKHAGIRVYSIRGNHDHYAKLANSIELPEHVVEFSGHKKVDIWAEHGIAFHGVSFREEHAHESALRAFKAPDERYRNIALLHTSLGGSEGHDVYAPCSATQLDSMGFNYWALGHIHKRSVSGQASTIVMPGTPQGRDIGEHGNKSVTLVCMDEHGDCELDEKTVSPIQFERIGIDIGTLNNVHVEKPDTTIRALSNEFIQRCTKLIENNTEVDRWIFRLDCTGPTTLLHTLRTDLEHTYEVMQLAADTLNCAHIEKIKFKPSEPDSKANLQAQHSDSSFIEELQSVVLNNLKDEHLVRISLQEFDDLVKLLPTKHARDLLNATPEIREVSIQEFQQAGI